MRHIPHVLLRPAAAPHAGDRRPSHVGRHVTTVAFRTLHVGCPHSGLFRAQNASLGFTPGVNDTVGWDIGSGTGYADAHAAATCLQTHEGIATDLAVTLQDPSSPAFCEYVTGATHNYSPDPKVRRGHPRNARLQQLPLRV